MTIKESKNLDEIELSKLIVPLQTYELNLESMKDKGFAFMSAKIEFSKAEENGEVMRNNLATL